MNIPGRDMPDLVSSKQTFPDSVHWRIEIAGIERPSTMEAMIEEARKMDLPVHRVIATVGGSTYCTFAELKDMASMARDEKIEVIMTVGSRKVWDVGSKELSTPEGGDARFQASRFRWCFILVS